ncbi:hypothetical protein LI328DRAFT_124850 [Trichoderma asperelloides]|nr:hypothetical protein LI328DRAFT_124850 [Trichoderma asperelloides]
MRRCAVLFSLCVAPRAFAAQCGSATIYSAADADRLRKSCSTVNGTITLQASLSENISLDGVQTITGNLTDQDCVMVSVTGPSPANSSITLLSSTLTTIHGDLSLGCIPALANVSLPNLKTVYGGFDIVDFDNLTYLDITNLESVGYFHTRIPTLRTMLHNELRNVTGAHGSKRVYVEQTSLASVDSLFQNPLDIGDSLAGVVLDAWTLKRLTHLNFGFSRAGSLSVGGVGNLSVTLGGTKTTSMKLTNLTFLGGVAELARNSNLANLTIDSVFLNGNNNFTDLLVPVDSMSNLLVGDEETLTRLELPPQAVNYTNFSFTAQSCRNLNLSSQFATNADGTTRQTWYWPQKDMNDIYVDGNVAMPFFQTWLDYEGNFTNATGRPVVNRLWLTPKNDSLVNCAPFEKLFKEGVIKTKYITCYSSLANSNLVFTPAMWGLMMIATVLHLLQL